MTDSQDTSITLSRVIDAPAEELFAAWTDPALIEQWLAEDAEFEAFEGGKFRFATTDADAPGTTHAVTGTVIGLEENRKLTELWQRRDGEEVEESTLIVTFRAIDSERTEITIVEIADAHEDPQSRIFSIEAWDEALAELADLLE